MVSSADSFLPIWHSPYLLNGVESLHYFIRKFCPIESETKHLRTYASAWLEENSPPKNYRSDKLDWIKLDAELLPKIDAAYEQLLSHPGKPVWINASSLSHAMGLRRNYLARHRQDLKETTKRLKKYEESNEQWAIRRLRWAGGQFLSEGKIPTLDQLLVLTGLNKKTIATEVMDEAKKVLEHIEKNVKG